MFAGPNLRGRFNNLANLAKFSKGAKIEKGGDLIVLFFVIQNIKILTKGQNFASWEFNKFILVGCLSHLKSC